MQPCIETAAAFIFGYLCGSIPFGVLLTRLAGAPDIRSIGSGNIGATNVLRTGRKGLAAATLDRRHAQGHRSGRIADRLFLGREAAIAAALGAFLGHLFPVWLELSRAAKASRSLSALLLGFGSGSRSWRSACSGSRSRRDPLFLARRAGCQRGNAAFLWWTGDGRRRNCFWCSPCCCGSCTAPISRGFAAGKRKNRTQKCGPHSLSQLAGAALTRPPPEL